MAPETTPLPSLLVIDDDDVMRELLSLVLAPAADPIHTAASGSEALALLAALRPAQLPSLILTDLQMPGLSGAALAAQLRAATPSTTRLIAMSGSNPSAAQTRAFDAFLLKPFSLEAFKAAAESSTPQTFPTTEVTTPEPLNEAIYTKLAAAMPATQLAQLYTLCLDDALTRITSMRAAAAAADPAAFTREAHAIKGGCGMLGATHLHTLATAMETGALASTPLLDDFTHATAHLRRMLDARR